MGEEMSQEIYVGNLLKKVAEDTDPASNHSAESEMNHQELQSIVNHLVHLPEDEESANTVKPARMTHSQLAAMRTTQSNLPAQTLEPKPPAKAIFQTIDAFMSLFRHAEKRGRCQTNGHECKHCGQVLSPGKPRLARHGDIETGIRGRQEAISKRRLTGLGTNILAIESERQ